MLRQKHLTEPGKHFRHHIPIQKREPSIRTSDSSNALPRMTGAPVGNRSIRTDDSPHVPAIIEEKHNNAAPVSARNLAARLWRYQMSEAVASSAGEDGGCWSTGYESGFQMEPSSSDLSDSDMESATKWDVVISQKTRSNIKANRERTSASSTVSTREEKFKRYRTHIAELETERFLLSDTLRWWRAEYEEIIAFISDLRAELKFEQKNRKRMEIVNSELIYELTEMKLTARRIMNRYETERRNREFMEEVSEELHVGIEEEKARSEALRRRLMKLEDEVEEERMMFRMATAWREQQVQMKLIDAKVALEEKYSQLSGIVADLERIFGSRTGNTTVASQAHHAEVMSEAESTVGRRIEDLPIIRSTSDFCLSFGRKEVIFPDSDAELEPSLAVSSPSSILRHLGAIFSLKDDSKGLRMRKSHAVTEDNARAYT